MALTTETDHERIREHVVVKLARRKDSEVSQVGYPHLRSSLIAVLLRNDTSGLRNTTTSPTWRNTNYGSCARSAIAAVVVEEKKGRDNSTR